VTAFFTLFVRFVTLGGTNVIIGMICDSVPSMIYEMQPMDQQMALLDDWGKYCEAYVNVPALDTASFHYVLLVPLAA